MFALLRCLLLVLVVASVVLASVGCKPLSGKARGLESGP